MKDTRVVLLALLSALAFIMLPHSVEAATTDEKSTTSNVTVNIYVSISLTTDFGDGLMFSTLDPSTEDNNATTCNDLGCNISVSGDTNVGVDIVMKANTNLTRGAELDFISYYNYTWNTTDGTALQLKPGNYLNISEYDYRTDYKVGDSVAASGVRSWQAWLDIPVSQSAGTYNNTLYFCGNQEDTTDCGS